MDVVVYHETADLAESACQLLRERGIAAEVRVFPATEDIARADLLVPEERAARAREILQEWRADSYHRVDAAMRPFLRQAAWVFPLLAAAVALYVMVGNVFLGSYPRAMAAGGVLAACLLLSGILWLRQRR